MSQLSFSDAEGQTKRKQTRREKFLAEKDKLLPWPHTERLITPYYAKSTRGRKPSPFLACFAYTACNSFITLGTQL